MLSQNSFSSSSLFIKQHNDTIRYNMIWYGVPIYLILIPIYFNLAFASLSCFSLTFSTEVTARVCKTQFAFKIMCLPDYSGGDTMAYLVKKMGWVCRVYIGCREDLCDKLQHLSYHFFQSCSWWHRKVGNRPEGSGIKWLSVEWINKLINIKFISLKIYRDTFVKSQW